MAPASYGQIDALERMAMHIAPLKERVSAQEWQLQIDPQIMKGMGAVMKTATAGQGAQLAWPALLRKLDRLDPGFGT